MASNKKNRTQNKSGKNLSPIEKLLKKKADSFIEAEREFWNYRYKIENRLRVNAKALDLGVTLTIPDEISSIVWGFRDGVAFVRYHSPGAKGHVSFRALNILLEEWGNNYLIIPTSEGDIPLAKAGIHGLGSFTFHNSKIGNIQISYLEISHAYYEKEQMPSPVERAIIDFQLSFLGIQLQEQKSTTQSDNGENLNLIKKLRDIASEFEILLDDSTREEELQTFLKKNPMVLHPTAELIPKKKLGEDFITDFVLVSPNDQGATYILVEIEKSSHSILTKDNSLSLHTNHAIKQTRDWDVWLEQHKAYIQGKLPGFETPKYIVVIGRGNNLDGTAKAYLRSYNRDWKNIELLTFDDILVRFNSAISVLENAINN